MKIYKADGALFIDVKVDDSSYQYKEIMGLNNLTLMFSLVQWVDFPIGCYCDFLNERYFLLKHATYKKNSSRNWEYTLVMESYQSWLGRIKCRSVTDIPKRLKFSLTGSPEMFLRMLADSMNDRDSGWEVGEFIGSEIVGTEAEPMTLTLDFNCEYCSEALQKIADAFKTEWEVDGKTIHLRRVERQKANPLQFSYGRGNGFLPGVGRVNDDSATSFSRLYIQGGNRNIDRTKYSVLQGTASDVLLLPKNETITLDERTYKTDSEGLYMERIDIQTDDITEGSIDLSHIYPSRVGTISAVYAVDDGRSLYDVADNTIPESLNFNNFLIPNETPILKFETGLLAGFEFEISRYQHANRRFELVPVNNLPKAPIIPSVGDRYAVFNVMLPDQYVLDAEQKMLQEAARYMYDNEEPHFTFSGKIDRIFLKYNWANVAQYLNCGYFISFYDEAALPVPSLVRVVSVKKYINIPENTEITLSNTTQRNAFALKMADVNIQEVQQERKDDVVMNFAKRRWQDIVELQNALYSIDGNFQDAVQPLWVQTMQMLVGAESLQFRFVQSDWETSVNPAFGFNTETKKFIAPQSRLQHQTLDIDAITSAGARGITDYKTWIVDELDSELELNADTGYYLYAKCSKPGHVVSGGRWQGDNAEFVLSDVPVQMEEVSGYYHFLVLYLGSEFDNNRSWRTMYGFTEILPGQITTDRIISSDGNTYFDLINNIVAGKFDFRDGLISSRIDLTDNEQVVTAGLQGANDVNVGAWFGGTYVDALAGLAKTILYKNGAAQFAGGNMKINENGEVTLEFKEDINGIITNIEISKNGIKLIVPQQYSIELFFERIGQSGAYPKIKLSGETEIQNSSIVLEPKGLVTYDSSGNMISHFGYRDFYLNTFYHSGEWTTNLVPMFVDSTSGMLVRAENAYSGTISIPYGNGNTRNMVFKNGILVSSNIT